MQHLPNVIIVAGEGNKSGKTSAICRIIECYHELQITAVKITPHFHELTEGLLPVMECEGHSIYEESNSLSSKDTSRMLRAGASKVYYIKVTDGELLQAFSNLLANIPIGTPIICESPALAGYIEPGILVIMTSDNQYNKKIIKHLSHNPLIRFKLEDLKTISSFPFIFREGKWTLQSGE